MADLTNERILLLDKLYNLRSDDSVITVKIQSNIDDLNNKISDTTEQKGKEVERKRGLESKLDTFSKQSSQFLESFSAYDNSSFESLKEVDIDIELGTLVAKLKESVPAHKEEIKDLINESEKTIVGHANHIEELNNDLTRRKIELEDAEEVKEKLNALLNDILLNHNDSYNRGYIKKILAELDVLTDEDKANLEYLILFPENGLEEYEYDYSNREHGNPFEEEMEAEKVEVEEEIPEEEVVEVEENNEYVEEETEYVEENEEEYVEEVEEETEEPVEEENEKVEETEETYDVSELLGTKEEIIPLIDPSNEDEINLTSNYKEEKEEKEEKQEEKEVSKDSEPYSELKSNLKKLNIDENKFKKEDYDNIMYLLNNTEYGVLALNCELLRSLEVNDNVLYKYIAPYNYMYLADPELSKKVSLIRSKGINDKKIKEELIKGNFTFSLSVMKDRIEALKTTGNELTEKNIGDIKADIIGFYKNILTLSDLGFELDDKEIRNFRVVLANSPYISMDAELLKDHLIKLVQKNGKYAMNVFWNSPKELELSIDTLEEAGLSNLIENNPEVLSSNSEMLVRRTNYCQEHNMPINENDDETEYCDYITDSLAFYRAFENVSLPKIPSVTETNKTIPKIAGNQEYANILIDSLNKYYAEPENLYKVEFSDKDLESTYEEITHSVSGVLNCTNETDRVYDISGVLVSKSKVLRNLKVILESLAKKNESIDGFEKDIILIAALYNLRVSKEQLEMIASNCLGDKKLSKELGGLAA